MQGSVRLTTGRGILMVVLLLAFGWSPAAAQAQPDEKTARAFIQVTAGVAARTATADPAGPGYLETYFHGPMPQTSFPLMVSGGVHVGGRMSLGGEAALVPSRSSMIDEASRTMFESGDLTSHYATNAFLTSIVLRGDLPAQKVTIQPLAGFSFSRDTRSLTERTGSFIGPTSSAPLSAPDVTVHSTHGGFVTGADVVIGHSRTAFVTGGRINWIHQDSHLYNRSVPDLGRTTIEFHAGVRWQTPRYN